MARWKMSPSAAALIRPSRLTTTSTAAFYRMCCASWSRRLELNAQRIAEEIERDQELKWDLQYGLKIKSIQQLDDLLLMNQWFLKKICECQAFGHSFDKLMNTAFVTLKTIP